MRVVRFSLMKISGILFSLLFVAQMSFAEELQIGNWDYNKNESKGVSASTKDEGKNNSLSIVCRIDSDDCEIMLLSKYQCKEGMGIPAIMSVDGDSIAIKVACAPRIQEMYPVLLFDKYEVNGLIAKGTTLSIAFPAGDGTINSYHFSLNGAVQAISMVYEQIKSLRK